MTSTADHRYLDTLLVPIRECAYYRPAFGKEADDGISLDEFRVLYGEDHLYHWVGLDSDLMYAAHKAAGGMTSIYRQLGIGCERLLREIIKDQYRLDDDQVAWSYEYEKEDRKMGVHTLDARIDMGFIANAEKKGRLGEWLAEMGQSLALAPERVAALRGVVLEVRQGYKSADSKRQNADLRFGARAYNENYLPAIAVVSNQVSETVCRRYRNAQIPVLRGTFGSALESTFSFYEEVVAYDLADFFDRNSTHLKTEVGQILHALLSAE